MPIIRPIIFSGPMVRALLDGRKTQTRRLAWRNTGSFVGNGQARAGHKVDYVNLGSTPIPLSRAPSPWQRVKPGDLLWVRENFHTAGRNCWDDLPKAPAPPGAMLGKTPLYSDQAIYYFASFDRSGKPLVHPSIHMPRWASRLTLEVTAVRVEPLQKITGTDALAEGITRVEGTAPWRVYLRLWNSLHGEGAWQKNPDVVALTFTVHKLNVDEFLSQLESPTPAGSDAGTKRKEDCSGSVTQEGRSCPPPAPPK